MRKIAFVRVAAPVTALVLVAGLAVWLGGGGARQAYRGIQPGPADQRLHGRLLPLQPSAMPSTAPTPTTGFEEYPDAKTYAAMFSLALAPRDALRRYRCGHLVIKHWIQSEWPARSDLVDCGTAARAAGYLAARQQAYHDADGDDHTFAEIPALPGGRLYTDGVGDVDGPTAVVLASHGSVVMQLTVWQRGGFDLGTVVDLARRQYARLDKAAPKPPAPAQDHNGDLVGLLLPRPPGTGPWDNEPGVAGNLTVDQAVDDFTENKDVIRQRFTSDHMDRAAVRTWTGGRDGTVKIFLYHFTSADFALQYAREDADDEDCAAAVEGHYGCLSSDSTVDENGDELARALTATGNLYVVVLLWKPHQVDLPGARNLLVQQLARL